MPQATRVRDESSNKSCSRMSITVVIIIITLTILCNTSIINIYEPMSSTPAKYKAGSKIAPLTCAKPIFGYIIDITNKNKLEVIISSISVIDNENIHHQMTLNPMKGKNKTHKSFKLTNPVIINQININSPNLDTSVVSIRDINGDLLWTNNKPIKRENPKNPYIINLHRTIDKQQVLSNKLSQPMQEQFLFYHNKF